VLLSLLDLVALGTVADIVPLDQNNRILVEQGIRRIRAGLCSAGLSALFEVSGRNRERAVTADLGFVCGPRLNAAGRLDDMSVGIECLLCENDEKALSLATTLNELNVERREIEAGMLAEALAEMDKLNLPGKYDLPPVICLYDENWHQGVIGILASRIKEKYHRPVIVFAPGDSGGRNDEIKGSARSISGLHIRDLLAEVVSQFPELVSKFGGHAMAAGLSLKMSNLDRFIAEITRVTHAHCQSDTFNEVIYVDGELEEDNFTLDMAETLRNAAPWGQHFPMPLFFGRFIILSRRLLKEKHLKLVLSPSLSSSLSASDDATSMKLQAIAFNIDIDQWPEVYSEVRLLYRLREAGIRSEIGCCDKSFDLAVESHGDKTKMLKIK